MSKTTARVKRDLLVFAPQGSSQHFTDESSFNILYDSLFEGRQQFDTILTRCKDAFQSELQSLDHPSKEACGFGDIDFTESFPDGQSLLFPPPSNRCHAVLETTSLYLRQVLELIAYQAHCGSHRTVSETSGVCTGLLCAVLASSFSSFQSPRFVDAAVETFRLSFWLGLRSMTEGVRPDSTAGTETTRRPSGVITVFGLPMEGVESSVTSYNESVSNA